MTVSGEEIPPQHQVFINYRGDELRKSFLGFVVKAMREAKINVFTDEVEVKGRDLQNLFRRIEESRVAVAILSERYTESSWCLDELVKMKEQMEQDMLVVIPIFYRLDATNCKRLVGTFGDNFRNLEREYRSEPERIKKWKEALISIPQKVGLTLAGHRDESELVESIVKEVKKVLIDVSSNERGQSNRTRNNIISSFEPLVAELDRLPPHLPQVFVSFCKEELGGNFVRHLVWAMRESGINVHIDSYNRRGKEDEKPQAFTSIEKSNIVLAIFSKRYSESDQCLNELVKMEELTKEGKLVVIPVFYNVKTNEVRRLQGEFGIHFADSMKRFSMKPMMVQRWEEALNFIIKRSTGLSLERHRNEFALVAAIVKEVARLLPNSRRMRRRRKLGIGEVFIRALAATFLFALFINPMPTPVESHLKIGNLLVGFPFLVVVLHKILC